MPVKACSRAGKGPAGHLTPAGVNIPTGVTAPPGILPAGGEGGELSGGGRCRDSCPAVESLLLKLPEQAAALTGCVVPQGLLVQDDGGVGLEHHGGLHGSDGSGDTAGPGSGQEGLQVVLPCGLTVTTLAC